eukprot:3824321-Pyramimonas_sp.AAC.1
MRALEEAKLGVGKRVRTRINYAEDFEVTGGRAGNATSDPDDLNARRRIRRKLRQEAGSQP